MENQHPKTLNPKRKNIRKFDEESTSQSIVSRATWQIAKEEMSAVRWPMRSQTTYLVVLVKACSLERLFCVNVSVSKCQGNYQRSRGARNLRNIVIYGQFSGSAPICRERLRAVFACRAGAQPFSETHCVNYVQTSIFRTVRRTLPGRGREGKRGGGKREGLRYLVKGS